MSSTSLTTLVEASSAFGKEFQSASLLPLQPFAITSPLETGAVRPRTIAQYHQAARLLLDFCLERGLNWTTASELDLIMVAFFSLLFGEGMGVGVGKKVMSAISHFLPDLSFFGTWRLPRARRALTGWGKLRPPMQRLPMPRFVALCIAGLMAQRKLPLMSLWVMVAFCAYLRPSECMRLKGSSLIPPMEGVSTVWGLLVNDWFSGIAGKTGVYDESVTLDCPFLYPCLLMLKQIRPGAASLWTFSMEALRKEFQFCCGLLGVGDLATHLYSLRHGGVSHDLLSKKYTLLEAQKRGRWQSLKAMRRYAKETRLLSEVEKLNPQLIALGLVIEQQFTDVVSGVVSPSFPPVALQAPPAARPRRLAAAAVRKRPSRAK